MGRVLPELLTFDAAYARFPEVFEPEGSGIPPGTRLVFRATPAELYPVFVAREIGMLAGLTVLAAVSTLGIIRVRRPYS